jgi:hypothetical protein
LGGQQAHAQIIKVTAVQVSQRTVIIHAKRKREACMYCLLHMQVLVWPDKVGLNTGLLPRRPIELLWPSFVQTRCAVLLMQRAAAGAVSGLPPNSSTLMLPGENLQARRIQHACFKFKPNPGTDKK